MMAADLGIGAHAMQTALETHVRQHLADRDEFARLEHSVLDPETAPRLRDPRRARELPEHVLERRDVVHAIGADRDPGGAEQAGAEDAPGPCDAVEPQRAQGAKRVLQAQQAQSGISAVELGLRQNAGVEGARRDAAEDLEVEPPRDDELLQDTNFERPSRASGTQN
jgi:hypothetical protein